MKNSTEKIKNISFSSWPKYSKKEVNKVKKIIETGKVNYWTGNYCTLFEKKFKLKFNLNYAISVANGSVALDAAVNVLKLSKRDEVLVTSRSYVSTASCLQNTPARIRFIDIDLDTQNIDIECIKKNINSKTKLIICTHLAGWPCDVDKIKKIIGKRKIYIIEDCSQAHGAMIKNKFVGSMGDISVWSFCNDKIISTLGEGGMVSTNNKKLFEKIWALKDIGKNYRKFNYKDKNNYKFRWLHDSIGTNARMTEIQAYAGLYQLRNLNKFIYLRKKNSEYIFEQLKSIPCLKFLKTPTNTKNVYYRLNFLFDESYNSKKLSRDIILKDMSKKINIREGSCPEIYNEKYFKENFNFSCPNAKYVGKNSLSLQVDHTINNKNLIKMTNLLKKYLESKL